MFVLGKYSSGAEIKEGLKGPGKCLARPRL